jgi:hypothetical protein
MPTLDRSGSGESSIRLRRDGKYEERLDDWHTAEYFEDPQTGLWRADVYHHESPEWTSTDHGSLEEAARAAREYVDQS